MVDGAHNPAGMEVLATALREQPIGAADIVAVVSILDDKVVAAMIGALRGVVTRAVATRSGHPRSLAPEAIIASAGDAIEMLAIDDPLLALARARELAGPDGLVVVCGSLYLVAGLRGVLANRANDVE